MIDVTHEETERSATMSKWKGRTRFSFVLLFGRLLVDAFEFDERAKLGDNHVFDYFRTTGEDWLVAGAGFPRIVVPDLTIRTFTVPTEVAIGN